jgi:Meiotically Up-regulated Gene 113 (MUG113) protein
VPSAITKAEILEEIRRTAAANGGVPLGRGRFEQITGISPYDWGRHWARFGDAQSEAGFSANVLNAAYEDDFLVEKLIDLMRELGKVPTGQEIRIKRFGDSEFPAVNTFDRLGSKNERIGRVLLYCGDKPELQDVVRLCEAAYEPDASAPEAENGRATAVSYGFVYLAKGHPGEYKIGRTNLVDRRVSELGATAAVEPRVVHEIKTDDPSGVEAYWHKRFESKRLRGEWFRLMATDVAAFKRWRRIA